MHLGKSQSGSQPNFKVFQTSDSFLRHLDRKNRLTPDGLISAKAFEARTSESTLSFTYQCDSLKNTDDLDKYQKSKELPSGDLPGLCKLTFKDLSITLKPPLPPRFDPNHSDPQYGHLHCATDLPRDVLHREAMAKLASNNGLVKPFVPKQKKI